MYKIFLTLLLPVLLLSCGDKKDEQKTDDTTVTVTDVTELKQQIESIETATEELKNTQESIEASMKKLDEMLNEIEN